MMQAFYTVIIYPLLLFGFRMLSLWNPKIKEGFLVRKNKSWLQPKPVDARVIWFHVASGELEYAKPVFRELKKAGPCFILVTYFSPSVTKALAKTSEVDLFVPMPWDTPWNWNEFINHYSPEVLAIARTDTWPNMVWQTRKKQIPSILFSATLPSHSGRYASFFGRVFYGSIVEALNQVSCVSENDRDNFLRLDSELRISVDGDTRFDQVLHRLAETRELKIKRPASSKVFVAGSTWPEDEIHLLPALKTAASRGIKSIIAPHEPTADHLSSLEKSLSDLGLRSSRYSSGEMGEVCIVDQVGVLADLYKLGSIAFVGGSFKKSVHSVMEPAAAGCLTVFGPYHYNNREALSLKSAGLAREISSADELESILSDEMLRSEGEIEIRKKKTIEFVQSKTGVSRQIAEWIKMNRRCSDQAPLQR
jgi:3-deoxy-D-manno-octulosonic-acid transferase